MAGASVSWGRGLSADSLKKIAAGLIFQSVTFGTTIYTFTLLVVPWSREFSVSMTEIMAASAALSLVSGFVSPIVGRLLDHHSVRSIVMAGLAMHACGMIVCGVASSFWHIIAGFGLLIGPGLACAGPLAAQVLVGRTVEPDKRGLALGWVLTGTSIGGIAFPPVLAFVIDAIGWRGTLIWAAPLSVLALAPIIFALSRESGTRPGHASMPPEPAAGVESSARSIITDMYFWVPILAYVPAMAAFTSVQYNLAPYATELGLTTKQASLIVSVTSGMMIVGKVVFGQLSDYIAHFRLCVISVLTIFGSLLAISAAPGFFVLAAGCAGLGVSSGAFLPLIAAMLSSHFGVQQFGRAMGLMMPFLTVAGFGPLLAGALYDRSGDYSLVFVTFAGATLAGLVAASVRLVTRMRSAEADVGTVR